MQELVSIITPMYNAEKYIRQTIESVLMQTYSNWEMIIVDDCSTDASAQIVSEYSAEDDRIKYYRNETNVGVSLSRNNAINLAKGRYIAFLDSDDLWEREKLEVQIQFMQEKNIHFCCSACKIIDENGNFTGKIRKVPDVCNYGELLKGNIIACLTVVIDTKYIPQITMPQISHEDYATWLKICESGECAYGINKVLASYRTTNNSVSGNKIKAAMWTWDIYRKYLKIPFFKAVYYFVYYAKNAVLKRI